MKLIDLVSARDALQKLVVQDLPLRTAYNLMNLVDECNKHLNFYGNELRKFDPGKDMGRMKELDEMEIEVERLTVSADDSLKLSATDIKLLLPLIDFEGL